MTQHEKSLTLSLMKHLHEFAGRTGANPGDSVFAHAEAMFLQMVTDPIPPKPLRGEIDEEIMRGTV